MKEGLTMVALDRFFDTYDRLAPSWLADILVTTAIVVSLLALIF